MTAKKGLFVKGDPRINRKGRPKMGETLADKFRDALAEKVNGDYSKLDSIIDKVTDMALKGNQGAIEFVLARGWGKMIDKLEITPKQENDLSRLTTEELDIFLALREKLDTPKLESSE